MRQSSSGKQVKSGELFYEHNADYYWKRRRLDICFQYWMTLQKPKIKLDWVESGWKSEGFKARRNGKIGCHHRWYVRTHTCCNRRTHAHTVAHVRTHTDQYELSCGERWLCCLRKRSNVFSTLELEIRKTKVYVGYHTGCMKLYEIVPSDVEQARSRKFFSTVTWDCQTSRYLGNYWFFRNGVYNRKCFFFLTIQ